MSLHHLDALTEKHKAALYWFQERVGLNVAWPSPIDGMFLFNKAKGIHKPKGLDYALSVRQSLDGPYEDALHWGSDNTWHLRHHHEGVNPDYFTNRAMNACRRAGVPVGVILQVQRKPVSLYKVLGLGVVEDDKDGVFTIRQFGSALERADDSVSLQPPVNAFKSTNVTDARLRVLQEIAVRRGQMAFRRQLLDAYDGACAISGCMTSVVLEAAHISPYRGDHTHHVQNGVLLRADLHTLFDLGLLCIVPETYLIHVSNDLYDSEYFHFHGKLLRLPRDTSKWPDCEALRVRWDSRG